MNFLERIYSRASQVNRTVVFPEGEEPRILAAVSRLKKDRVVVPILLGDPDRILKISKSNKLDISGIQIIDPIHSDQKESYISAYYELRKHKGLSLEEASESMNDPIYYGTMMVKMGIAHGYLAGAVTTTAKTVQAGLRILKTKPGVKKISSFFFMVMPDENWGSDGLLVFADPAIVVDMDAETMAEIAVMSAENAQKIAGIEPRVAMLSYSTKGSGKGISVDMVQKATKIAQEMRPDILIDGDLQADAAIVESVGKLKAPGSLVAGKANILIFPSIESANIGYKLVQRLAHATAVGPILQGLSKPANDLSRGCTIDDIVYTAAITALQE